VKWGEFIKDYLTFTRKERIGILTVVAVILLTLFLPDILSDTARNRPIKMDTTWMEAVKRSEIKVQDSLDDNYQKNDNENAYAYQYDKRKSSYNETDITKGELFYFDPNTITGSEWKRLGIR